MIDFVIPNAVRCMLPATRYFVTAMEPKAEEAVWSERLDRVAALAMTVLSEGCCPLPSATCGGAQTDPRTECRKSLKMRDYVLILFAKLLLPSQRVLRACTRVPARVR